MSAAPPNLVANIGGTFIYSNTPKELAEWYRNALGLQWGHTEEYNAFYAVLKYRELDDDRERGIVWSIMQAKDRPAFEGKVFTVNYRVHSMEATVAHLKSLGISVKGPEKYPEGIFAWITDPDDNGIELWEEP